MTWSNYGIYWHCDHVIPANKFNLNNPTQILLCFNWKNLSPLTKKDNMNKKDKIIPEQINTHIDNLKIFIKNENIKTDIDNYLIKYKEHLDIINCETP